MVDAFQLGRWGEKSTSLLSWNIVRRVKNPYFGKHGERFLSFAYILFDLDGTLTDPGIGITNSVMYALGKCGLPIPDRRSLYRFIGPPLTDSFEEFYGFSRERAAQAVSFYREYFQEKGLYENAVYDGIPELLGRLRDAGKVLLVASSKPEVFVVRILEHFGLSKYFTVVAGSNLDGTRAKKDEVIQCALERMQIADLTGAVMVGDREHDILGAKKTGLVSVGVLFGYGGRQELEQAGADHIAGTVEGLGEILLSV